MKLTDYQINPDRGFLPAEDPLTQLPPAFEMWETIANNLSTLIMTGQLRPMLEKLEPINVDYLEDNRQWQRAMLLLSMMGNGYVWGEAKPATVIPRGVAVPWAQVSEQLNRPMIISHASIVLYNWRRLDQEIPLTLENLDTLQLFLGGIDEKWFYLTTVCIEAKGAPALQALVEAQQAALTKNIELLVNSFRIINSAVAEMLNILLRIPEKCDPYIFYHRIRPFLAGWESPGIIYEGVSSEPQLFAGGSAAQSSLIQSLDAGLGVEHIDDKSRPFLLEMRRYMPPPHRHFIEALETGPSIPQFVLEHQSSYPILVDLYNECLQALDTFRKKHLELTVRYIVHQADDSEEAKGTGGTSFVPFLSTARQETRKRFIKSEKDG